MYRHAASSNLLIAVTWGKGCMQPCNGLAYMVITTVECDDQSARPAIITRLAIVNEACGALGGSQKLDRLAVSNAGPG